MQRVQRLEVHPGIDDGDDGTVRELAVGAQDVVRPDTGLRKAEVLDGAGGLQPVRQALGVGDADARRGRCRPGRRRESPRDRGCA